MRSCTFIKDTQNNLASPPNPFDQTPPPDPGPQVIFPPPSELKPPDEDPPWTGWDVLGIAGITLASIVVLPTIIIAIARALVYRNMTMMQVARIPEMILAAQVFMYIVVFAAMYQLLKSRTGDFWRAIRWNWPTHRWLGFLLSGMVLYFVLAGLGNLLPIPKHLPIDKFFETARQATILSIMAVTLAPLMEELFFRGFLYPVLARRLGVAASIFLTAAAFAVLHGAQLKYSWAVLIIFLVGLALTVVRAKTKSVAASFLLHVGYNGTLSVLMFAVTGGFRHLEKLNHQ